MRLEINKVDFSKLLEDLVNSSDFDLRELSEAMSSTCTVFYYEEEYIEVEYSNSNNLNQIMMILQGNGIANSEIHSIYMNGEPVDVVFETTVEVK